MINRSIWRRRIPCLFLQSILREVTMMKKTLRWGILAVLLLICVMIPVTAQRASAAVFTEDQELWIGDTQVIDSRLSGTGWSYNPSTKTLTLSDLTVTTANNHDDMAIYAANLDLTITGTATLTGTDYGIEVDGGSLTISGGNITAKGTNSFGIYIHNSDENDDTEFYIKGGTVKAVGAAEGIVSDGNVRISGGTVTAQGTDDYSDGIWAYGSIVISGGTVIGTGKNIGINAVNSITVSGESTKVTATGKAEAGLQADSISIQGGTVTAEGTDESADGIYTYGGVVLSGGTTVSTGGDAGIFATAGMTVSGETTKVTAMGDTYRGIQADSLSVKGGTVTVSGYDGIYVDSDVSVSGGKLSVSNCPYNGIYASGSFTVSGGTVEVNATSDGITAGTFTVSGTAAKVTAKSANDFSLNCGQFTLKSGTVTAEGKSVGISASDSFTVFGGTLTASGGDFCGLDLYGSASISGGTVKVTGSEGICSYGSEFSIKGGTVTVEGNTYGFVFDSSVYITKGTVTVIGKADRAFYTKGPSLSGYSNCRVLVNTAASASGATQWTGTDPVNGLVENYKYVKIEPSGSSTPTITTQPTSKTVAAGTSVSFKVVATGATSYQWQLSSDGGTTWKNCSSTGYNTDTFTFTAGTAQNNRRYRCVVTNSSGSVTSSAAKLTVVGITTQPTSKTVTAGTSVSFKVVATGATSYQWQLSSDGGTTWKNCSSTGYNTDTFTFTAGTAQNGRQYRCQVKNGSVTVTSSAAKLTVTSTSGKPTITTQPKSVTAYDSQTATFTVVASGSNLSYQWYYKSPSMSSFSKCSEGSYNTATYTVTAMTSKNGYQYYCVVTNSAGTATSNTVTLTVK